MIKLTSTSLALGLLLAWGCVAFAAPAEPNTPADPPTKSESSRLLTDEELKAAKGGNWLGDCTAGIKCATCLNLILTGTRECSPNVSKCTGLTGWCGHTTPVLCTCKDPFVDCTMWGTPYLVGALQCP